MTQSPLLESSLPGILCRRGKVRDVYDLGDTLLLVSSDRISAYDWVMPNGVPDKGRVLTEMSNFWFALLADSQLGIANHLLETDVTKMDLPAGIDIEPLAGRTILVRKTQVVPVECVVRGYLSGSGWQEYQESQTVCGVELPPGLVESDQLPEPIFTPATKAEQGDHDENITFQQMCNIVGQELSEELREKSIDIYQRGAEHARSVGIILADTKFEFGQQDGKLILIDEAMTPDSSRFWPADQYEPGSGQPSYDKQFVRDWLTQSGWDKNSEPPELPEEVVAKTRAKYVEAFELITGATFAW
ncbi:phosphoribosylaminoimidazolesuccinocarboxamide synthase [Adhaeretor mobilis]|uniref:Phosphoribosylaminoimidazole-succinocarboxamide synthase n=1 Tax=Adhaeretor mobilis TaxID=1930276 RepID=A0A517N0T7_9BACT|nr:phosphoribosylaminoimidazolesuccinocarboxamide synthase [Adhaeretor mobilis]QDT00638.1 Phosphoribosylaminoimidazole-succinocarboxamide synthase [Adhaeretor mobilis]